MMQTNAFGIPVEKSIRRSTDLCPDCRADLRIFCLGGLIVLRVEHDDTCPRLAQLEREREDADDRREGEPAHRGEGGRRPARRPDGGRNAIERGGASSAA